MKYRDLMAVQGIDRDEMTAVVGGESYGEYVSGNVPGLGRPHTPNAQAAFLATGTDTIGELIQYRSEQYGYPGNNAIKRRLHDAPYFLDIDLPPGLPPGN